MSKLFSNLLGFWSLTLSIRILFILLEIKIVNFKIKILFLIFNGIYYITSFNMINNVTLFSYE